MRVIQLCQVEIEILIARQFSHFKERLPHSLLLSAFPFLFLNTEEIEYMGSDLAHKVTQRDLYCTPIFLART